MPAKRNKRSALRHIRTECLERRALLSATTLQVTVENLSPDGGLAATPFWVAFHDGRFQVGRQNRSADNFGGLELLAEEGDTSELSARFDTTSQGVDTTITAPDGFAGAPVFEPGETVSQVITVENTRRDRYFSFASMIIPSNDAFVANLNSREYQVFNRRGRFVRPVTINIYGRDVWDAGTEVNNVFGGAAFSTEGGASVGENGVIHRSNGLDDFVGSGLPTGFDLESAFIGQTPLARITISLASRPSGPVDRTGPEATLVAETVTEAGAGEHQLQVIYSDPSGVNAESIGTNDLRIIGPRGQSLRVGRVTTDAEPGTSPATVIATYTVVPTDGEFNVSDNGNYRVSLNRRSISDSVGNSTRVARLGSFAVDVSARLQITIESLAPDGGISQTPFWVGVHDGRFDLGTAGRSASRFGGLELLAEEGDTSGVSDRFAATSSGVDTTITSPAGFAGAPVFEPGEVVMQTLDVPDPDRNRYFSYASMIIPSNDAFSANLNSREVELFDRQGRFRGPQTINIFGRNVWDAGTEVNDPFGGAAFSTEGGGSVEENGVIHRLTQLDDFIGSGLPTGSTLVSAFSPDTLLARITITLIS